MWKDSKTEIDYLDFSYIVEIMKDTVKLLVEYLCYSMSIQTLKAFVMPENIYSESKAVNLLQYRNMSQLKKFM